MEFKLPIPKRRGKAWDSWHIRHQFRQMNMEKDQSFSLYALHAFRGSPVLRRFMKREIVPAVWTFEAFCAIVFVA